MVESPAPTTHFATPRWEHAGPWLLGLLLALPLLLTRFPPSADMAEYEMELAGLVGLGDVVRFPTSLYRVEWGAPNQLIFLLGWPLAVLLGADMAIRLLTAGVVLLSGPVVARLARSQGSSAWLAAVAAPMFLGVLFRWGLLANLLSTLLVLAILPALQAHQEQASWRRGIWVAVGTMLAVEAHASALPVLATVALSWCVGRPWRGHLWRVLPLAPAGVTLVLQMVVWGTHASSYFRDVYTVNHPLGMRLAALPRNLVGPGEPMLQALVLGFMLLALALLGTRQEGEAQLVEAGQTWRRYLPGALLMLQYFVWPYSFQGAGMLNARFLLPGVVMVVVSLGPRRRVQWGLAKGAAAVVPVLVLGLQAGDFMECHAGFAALDEVMPNIPEGSSVMVVDLVEPAGGLAMFTHAAAHVVAHRGGRARSYAELPQYPFVVHPELTWERTNLRAVLPARVVPAHDLKRYGWVLGVVGEEADIGLLARALGDMAELRQVAFPWVLFRSRILVEPITAPDQELPNPSPPTLEQLAGAAG